MGRLIKGESRLGLEAIVSSPLTKLSKSQQERFILLLKNARNPDEKYGIVQSLLTMGYAVKEK